MHDLTIAAIRRRLRDKFTDLGGAPNLPLPCADPAVIASDEERLGFALPPLLKRIYAEFGNGGFGPGYGLIGVTGGVPDDQGKTSPAIYEQFRTSHPGEPGWTWPDGLLPICHWGCAILSSVDCADANFRMRVFDPNLYQGSWAECFFDEAVGFDAWIRDWASGVDLWDRMYGEQGPIAQAISARQSPG